MRGGCIRRLGTIQPKSSGGKSSLERKFLHGKIFPEITGLSLCLVKSGKCCSIRSQSTIFHRMESAIGFSLVCVLILFSHYHSGILISIQNWDGLREFTLIDCLSANLQMFCCLTDMKPKSCLVNEITWQFTVSSFLQGQALLVR